MDDRRSGEDRRADDRGTERRKGGRPKAAAQGARVSGWIDAPEADRLAVLSIRRRESVSSLVKRAVRMLLAANL